jgi:hypothetical protein
VVSILTAHDHLFEKGKWMDFRRQHMITEQKRGPTYDFEENSTKDTLNYEFEALLEVLEPKELQDSFGFNIEKERLICFNCTDARTSACDRTWDFAQRKRTGVIRCAVCSHFYTLAQYEAIDAGNSNAQPAEDATSSQD